ncbi:MAG: hypothetical protein ABIP87_02135 [Thermomonas sp.]
MAAPAGQLAGSADTQTQPETEAQAYVAKIDRTLALAAQGQYGKLKRGSAEKLQVERDRIASVLAIRATVADLSPAEALTIQNAEDGITAILRNKEKDRMVCTREIKTGTRFSTSECMTVSQREARAASAAEATGKVQREICIAGEGNTCAN